MTVAGAVGIVSAPTLEGFGSVRTAKSKRRKLPEKFLINSIFPTSAQLNLLKLFYSAFCRRFGFCFLAHSSTTSKRGASIDASRVSEEVRSPRESSLDFLAAVVIVEKAAIIVNIILRALKVENGKIISPTRLATRTSSESRGK